MYQEEFLKRAICIQREEKQVYQAQEISGIKKKPTSVKVEEKLNIYNWKQRMTYRLEEIIQNEKEKIKDIKYAYE